MNTKAEERRQARDILNNTKKMNRQLAATRRVPPSALGRYVNLETGNYEMRGLIEDILRANGAMWPGVITTPADRATVIDASMYTEEILEAARILFTAGTHNYTPSSLRTCLRDRMLRRGEVGKIELTASEDSTRAKGCDRPRCKWYWALA